MMRSLPLLVILLGGATGAHAQDAGHLAAAESLLVQMEVPTVYERSIDTVLEQQFAQNPMLAPYADVMEDFMRRTMTWDAIREPMVRMYAEAFTEAELHDLSVFYATETGRKSVRLMPDLMAKGMALGQQIMAEHQPELERALADRRRELTP